MNLEYTRFHPIGRQPPHLPEDVDLWTAIATPSTPAMLNHWEPLVRN